MNRMRAFGERMVLVAIVTLLAGCSLPALPDAGKIYVDRWAEIKGSDKDVSEILAAFNRAEEALHARDLDGLMALYSEQYRYHGLSKSDLRKIWEEMFASYDNLASTHTFSRIHVGRISQAAHRRYFLYRQLVGIVERNRKSSVSRQLVVRNSPRSL